MARLGRAFPNHFRQPTVLATKPTASHDALFLAALSPLLTVKKIGSGSASESSGLRASLSVLKIGSGAVKAPAGERSLITGNKVGNPSTVIFSQAGAQFIDTGKKIGTNTARTTMGALQSLTGAQGVPSVVKFIFDRVIHKWIFGRPDKTT